MTTRHLSIALAIVLGASGVSSAQPAPAPAPAVVGDRVDAKSLMQSGVKLLEAKDYLGALAVFKDAFQRFPSAKILLNIGTTYKLLGRDSDAANTYQRYLDAKDNDPAKHAGVTAAISELDKRVGRLTLVVTPADAEVQIGDDDWLPAAAVATWRVPPGTVKLRARRDGYTPTETTATATAGGSSTVTIALVAVPVPVAVATGPHDLEDNVVPEVESGPRSRVGALVIGHFDLVHSGGAGLVGVTFDATERLEIQLAALLGPNFGGYGGVAFALLTGDLRPIISAGMPVFADGGARYSVRGAVGLEYEANKHLSLILEVGVEHSLNPGMNIDATAFIPALGAAARL